MSLSATMINTAVRLRLGIGLAEFYDAHATAMPLLFTEQLARLAVAEATAEFDRSTDVRNDPAVGARPT